MELVRLALRNFRQHVETDVAFRPGLTAVLGPNGAGKTTLLEGIAWALYGSDALRGRGTQEGLRFLRADPQEPVEACLLFRVDHQEYRVQRQLVGPRAHTQARLWQGATLQAEGPDAVSRRVRQLLGLSVREFFATYFTGQKELAFLTKLGGPAERRRFLGRLLGHDRIERMRQRVRERYRELLSEAEGLRRALPDATQLAQRRQEAEARRAEAQRRQAEAERTVTAAAAERERAETAWQAICQRWERRQEWEQRHRQAADEAVRAAEEEARHTERLQRLTEADARRRELEAQLIDLPAQRDRLREFDRRRLAWERARALEEQIARLRNEHDRVLAERDRRRDAPAFRARFEARRAALDDEIAATQRAIEERLAAHRGDQADADAQLRQRAAERDDLRERIATLERHRGEGICPVCRRPLGDRYEEVLERLRTELDRVEQDLRWWEQRRRQLEREPEDLHELRTRLAQRRAEREEVERKVQRCVAAVAEYQQLERRAAELDDELARLAAERAALDVDYDPTAHDQLRHELERLEALDRERARLEAEVAERAAWQEQLDAARERRRRAEAERDEFARRLATDAIDPAAYEAARQALEAARQAYETALQEHSRAAEQIRAEERLLEELAAQEAQRARMEAELQRLQGEARLHEELEEALKELFEQLNRSLGPEISERASQLVAELTDHRYTELRLDDQYQIVLVEDGYEKRLLSGGEEDLVHLVLRVVLAETITANVQRPLHLLVLDEVFGSLDEERRDHVLEMLHALQGQFAQILAISHIDGIRDRADQVLRVEYDPLSGSARVREELPGLSVGEASLAGAL